MEDGIVIHTIKRRLKNIRKSRKEEKMLKKGKFEGEKIKWYNENEVCFWSDDIYFTLDECDLNDLIDLLMHLRDGEYTQPLDLIYKERKLKYEKKHDTSIVTDSRYF
jgi:hypothetical protein